MSFCRVFPRPFAVCFVLSLLSLTTLAQQAPTRTRLAAQDAQPTTTTQTDGHAKLENDLVADAPADLVREWRAREVEVVTAASDRKEVPDTIGSV